MAIETLMAMGDYKVITLHRTLYHTLPSLGVVKIEMPLSVTEGDYDSLEEAVKSWRAAILESRVAELEGGKYEKGDDLPDGSAW